MTTKEFEDFLLSIGGLQNGWKESAPIVKNLCECDEGWLQLISDCIKELIAAGWDKQILQIKEKFGGLRFYTGPLFEEGYKIISKYESLSYTTCEICGNPGEPSSKGWIKTLCEKCLIQKTTNDKTNDSK